MRMPKLLFVDLMCPRGSTGSIIAGFKVQLMGSIIVIAAITTLRVFIEINAGAPIDAVRLTWIIIIFAVFLLSALISAVINRLKHIRGDHRDEGDL